MVLAKLFDRLWTRYRALMDYARRYEALFGSLRNDHVAFRTIADERHGIHSTSRLFEALGYAAAACYEFPDKKLSSIHYAHPDPALPKVFISQLKSWELSPASRRIVERSLKAHRAPAKLPPTLAGALRHFSALPWPLPRRKDVLALNEESQFGAWVLLNGYDVNHFTAAVDDIEAVVAKMRAAGIPMKAEIEGARGARLRQSSTEAVVIPARTQDGPLPWTYAYFELAERPLVDGKRFEGFFGAQATNLFEMTKVR